MKIVLNLILLLDSYIFFFFFLRWRRCLCLSDFVSIPWSCHTDYVTLHFNWNMIIFYQDGLNILICCVYDILNRFWLCTFTLTVSLGAVLLLPMSIFSNEIMIMYPNSYYIKWLNGSLIHGRWFRILSCYVYLKQNVNVTCYILSGPLWAFPTKLNNPLKLACMLRLHDWNSSVLGSYVVVREASVLNTGYASRSAVMLNFWSWLTVPRMPCLQMFWGPSVQL